MKARILTVLAGAALTLMLIAQSAVAGPKW
jgi:hypothetical protein